MKNDRQYENQETPETPEICCDRKKTKRFFNKLIDSFFRIITDPALQCECCENDNPLGEAYHAPQDMDVKMNITVRIKTKN
jgi:hypothetical protein